jgi:hypothetical protein
MRDPQSEGDVWLHGLGSRLNVTGNHVIACASPSTADLGLNGEWRLQIKSSMRLLLKFNERGGGGGLLGKIGLPRTGVVRTGGGDVHLSWKSEVKTIVCPGSDSTATLCFKLACARETIPARMFR